LANYFRIRSRDAVLACTLGFVLATPLIGSAQRRGQQQDRDRDQQKLEQAQREEAQALVKLVDGVMEGEPAPSQIPASWRNDFLKALEGRTYVPFTVNLEPEAIKSPSLLLYLRVVDRNAAAPPAPRAPDAQEAPDAQPEAEARYAFEDLHFVDLKPGEAGKGHGVSRAFAVPAGEYDVYVALRERDLGAPDAEPQMTVLRESLTVPDFWNEELATSSVIVAERVDPVDATLTPEQQAERPYVLGTTEIVPARETTFGKKDELSVIFLIYNPQVGADRKPNVTVEYNFHHKTADGEKFFNRTEPQDFNAQTLPEQFDIEAGHQLVAGQSVPLASFPEGDYRLEITVTDKHAGTSLQRDVNFTVVGS
jgi:hypothetical protein